MASQSTPFKFMGPAQQEFPSLHEQATYFLNNFWSGWRNYENPKSCLIPSAFKYKNAEVSDEVCKNIQQTSEKPLNIVVHRQSDEAEHLVYRAVEQLLSNNSQAPFICTHGLDLGLNYQNGKYIGTLVKIFPSIDWERFRKRMNAVFPKQQDRINQEYDFVLIGPHIGIIVIEVKSSAFEGKKGFQDGSPHLPEGYSHGLKQLKSANALVVFLEECTGIAFPSKIPIQTILFTPNLKKTRFEEWYENLQDDGKCNVKAKCAEVHQWFYEHATDMEVALQYFLHFHGQPIPSEVYEAYGPILAAIASVPAVASRLPSPMVDLSTLASSEAVAVAQQHKKITEHNPLKEGQLQLMPKSTLVKAPKDVAGATGMTSNNKVIFLTPDQQKALKGPNRQVIVGAAGTGKTVILQAKALQLLANGESVTIVAPWNFMQRYTQLFSEHGYKNYTIKRHIELYSLTKDTIRHYLDGINQMSDLQTLSDGYFNTDDPKYNDLRAHTWLEMEDHVLIDDALDIQLGFQDFPEVVLPLLLLKLAIAEIRCPKKVVWTAMDFLGTYRQDNTDHKKPYEALRDSLVKHAQEGKTSPITITVLRQVMRCSLNVFTEAYKPAKHEPPELAPVLAHKIAGMTSVIIREVALTLKEAYSALASIIAPIIIQLMEKDIPLTDIAFVIGKFVIKEEVHLSLLHQLRQYEQCRDLVKNFGDIVENREGDLFYSELWQDLSSLEWPIVIYVDCISNYTPWGAEDYARYRALTRATVRFYDICVAYEDDDVTIFYENQQTKS